TIGKRLTFSRVLFAAALVCVLISLGILTGRRKMLVEITIFLTTYAFLVAWLQRSAARLAIGAAVVGVAAYVAIIAFVAPDLVGTPAPRPDFDVENARRLEDYALRGQSVFAELPRRISAVGVQPLLWAVDRFGWTGAGLGTGSQ